MKEMTIIIIADSENRDNIPALLESIRNFGDVDGLTVVIFDNEAGGTIREWGSMQEDIIFAYSDEGVIPYGKAVTDIMTGLDIFGDVLFVPGTHLLVPGVLSSMMEILYSSDSVGVVGANFAGSTCYGLGKDYLISGYQEISDYSRNCDYKPYETELTDPAGTLLIRGELLRKLANAGLFVVYSEGDFKKALCLATDSFGYEVVADRADFWGSTLISKRLPKPEGVFLSICVPTFNRGRSALNLGRDLLVERENYDLTDIVEIIFSDNASEREKDDYSELEKMSFGKEKFYYFRNNENIGAEMNFINVLSKASGKFAVVLSDEDRIRFDNLLIYISYLMEHPEISIMKGLSNFQYDWLLPRYTQQGKHALSAYYLRGNYISGVIYNRNIFTNEAIMKLHDRFALTNKAYFYYPHLFWDAFLLVNGSFASSDIQLVIEGAEENYNQSLTDNGLLDYEYYEERIVQGIGYTELVKELNIEDDSIALYIVLNAYEKTMFLLDISRKRYKNADVEWDDDYVLNRVESEFEKALTKIHFEDAESCLEIARDYMKAKKEIWEKTFADS